MPHVVAPPSSEVPAVPDEVLDRLADVLYASDEILGLLAHADAARKPGWLAPVRPQAQSIYDRVNALMKRLSP